MCNPEKKGATLSDHTPFSDSDGKPPHSKSTQFSHQLRHHLKQIIHDPITGNRENRRFGVFVNSDDHLAVSHPRQMLNRAGNADGDVQIGGDNLAGLADLIIVRHEA